MNKTTYSDRTRKSGPPRALRAPDTRRAAAADRTIPAAGPAERFRAPRLSRAASELLRRYFGMQTAQAV